MVKLRRIKSSGKRRKLLLLFVLVSILFISCGYAIVNSNLGFLGTLFVNHYENQTVIQAFSMNDKTKFRSDTYREKIETITLSDSINPPSNYEESWNLGVNNKSGVKDTLLKEMELKLMYMICIFKVMVVCMLIQIVLIYFII